jgi:hypothetical protein
MIGKSFESALKIWQFAELLYFLVIIFKQSLFSDVNFKVLSNVQALTSMMI